MRRAWMAPLTLVISVGPRP